MTGKVFLVDLCGSLWKTPLEMGANRFDPLHLGYLGAFLKANGLDAEIFQQRHEPETDVIGRIAAAEPDILAVSSMTYNFNASRRIAGAAKKKLPNLKTVFGGCHASTEKRSLEYPEIDYVVIGEGEHTLLELVNAITEGRSSDLEKVAGIGFKKEGKAVHTPPRERIRDLDALPFPIRYHLDECKMGEPMLPVPDEQHAFAQVAYSRGCFYNCSFCNAPEMWKRTIVHRSAANVVDEIEYLMNFFGTNSLFFTDLTFNADKNKVRELCEEIANRGIDISWSASCRVTADEDLLRLMRDAGCVRLAYGVETTENKTLASINKRQTFEDAKACFEITNSFGMITRAYLMIGYPGESYASMQRTAEHLLELPADQIRVAFVTPFPGTAFYEQAQREGIIITENLDDYTTDIPVAKTNMSQRDLMSARHELFARFYSSEEYQKRIMQKGMDFPHLKKAYDSFFQELKKASFI